MYMLTYVYIQFSCTIHFVDYFYLFLGLKSCCALFYITFFLSIQKLIQQGFFNDLTKLSLHCFPITNNASLSIFMYKYFQLMITIPIEYKISI